MQARQGGCESTAFEGSDRFEEPCAKPLKSMLCVMFFEARTRTSVVTRGRDCTLAGNAVKALDSSRPIGLENEKFRARFSGRFKQPDAHSDEIIFFRLR